MCPRLRQSITEKAEKPVKATAAEATSGTTTTTAAVPLARKTATLPPDRPPGSQQAAPPGLTGSAPSPPSSRTARQNSGIRQTVPRGHRTPPVPPAPCGAAARKGPVGLLPRLYRLRLLREAQWGLLPGLQPGLPPWLLADRPPRDRPLLPDGRTVPPGHLPPPSACPASVRPVCPTVPPARQSCPRWMTCSLRTAR